MNDPPSALVHQQRAGDGHKSQTLYFFTEPSNPPIMLHPRTEAYSTSTFVSLTADRAHPLQLFACVNQFDAAFD